jgi:hypothetical protein
MLNLFKSINYCLFYFVSKIYKKYDYHFKIGELYFVYGAAIAGMMIGALIINSINIIGAFFQPTPFWLISKLFAYIPGLTGITCIFIFGYKNFHLVVFEQLSKMDKLKRKRLGIISTIYFLITTIIFFNIVSIVGFIFSVTH